MPRESPQFAPYEPSDRSACLELFDQNSPSFFAPNERPEYADFLDANPVGYEVVRLGGRLVGVYGLSKDHRGAGRLNWIMVDPESHGSGVGSAIMRRLIDRARQIDVARVEIAASHLSEPFFERFGAHTKSVTTDGWGPGMHRHDMTLDIGRA